MSDETTDPPATGDDALLGPSAGSTFDSSPGGMSDPDPLSSVLDVNDPAPSFGAPDAPVDSGSVEPEGMDEPWLEDNPF